jgi:AcrR family transcriptional regulator
MRRRPAASAAPRRRPRRGTASTRDAVFAAAAEAFSRKGFDGVVMDDIAAAAGVNKAMIYYHFADKLALYRAIFADMARSAGARASAIADANAPPSEKIERWVETFVAVSEERPYMPPLLLREIAEGAPHLDAETLALIKVLIVAFGRIIAEGQARKAFRPVNPLLAYITLLAPLMFNAARERAAAQRANSDFPMFVSIPHAELIRHMQQVGLRMLKPTKD